MIGTFQAETDEEIAYGLVHPLASWDPIWAQVRSLLRAFQVEHFKQGKQEMQQSNGFLTFWSFVLKKSCPAA